MHALYVPAYNGPTDGGSVAGDFGAHANGSGMLGHWLLHIPAIYRNMPYIWEISGAPGVCRGLQLI